MAMTMPIEVAVGPDSLDSSAVNGMSSNPSSNDGGKIRTVMSMLIVNTSDISNSTSSDSSNAADVVGNVGVGTVTLNNHMSDVMCLIVITAAVNLNSGTG